MNTFNNIQKFCGEINEAACYSLCLLNVGEEYNSKYNPKKTFDTLTILNKACSGTKTSDIIYYNRNNLDDNDNFYVQHPDLLLQSITGKKWDVRKEYDINYIPKKNEYVIKYYEREQTGKITGHFERDNFHPIDNSLTVKYGKLKTLRICKVL